MRADRSGVVLDAGAFIALERRSQPVVHLFQLFRERGTPLVTSAGVVAQVWRGTARQAPIAFVLQHTRVVDLGREVARVLGKMLGATGHHDPIDAHVVLLARERGWPVLTSDPDDLHAIDPRLRLEVV